MYYFLILMLPTSTAPSNNDFDLIKTFQSKILNFMLLL